MGKNKKIENTLTRKVKNINPMVITANILKAFILTFFLYYTLRFELRNV